VLGIPKAQTDNSTTLGPVRAATNALRHLPGVIGVAGEGAISIDYQKAVFGNFPLMFAVIALLTFILLARAFRSILLALKAIVLNLLSLAAAFGVITWFWQQGHGSDLVFGIPATGAVAFWLPLMIFAFMYGLSMDYEVFILTRIREQYEQTGSTTAAVTEGLGRTGRLVTSTALILFLAFASLASAPNTDIKVLATGLGDASSSTPPSSAPSYCPPSSPSSAAGTGGCPPCLPGCCASNQRQSANQSSAQQPEGDSEMARARTAQRHLAPLLGTLTRRARREQPQPAGADER
jgi:hypothetical protein